MTESKMKYPRGTVLKWTRKAMAASAQAMPYDRMIVLDASTVIWYDANTNEVLATDMFKTQDSYVEVADGRTPHGLTIDVKEMSNDPGIPALIAEFGMVSD